MSFVHSHLTGASCSSPFESIQLVLPRSKYFSAVGAVTEAALTKILDDVLALGDIPELDSKRLSELCRILNAVEGLFVDDSDPEMVRCVGCKYISHADDLRSSHRWLLHMCLRG